TGWRAAKAPSRTSFRIEVVQLLAGGLVAPGGGPAVQGDGRRQVVLHPPPLLVADGQVVHRTGVSLLRRLPQPGGPGLRVSRRPPLPWMSGAPGLCCAAASPSSAARR